MLENISSLIGDEQHGAVADHPVHDQMALRQKLQGHHNQMRDIALLRQNSGDSIRNCANRLIN